MSIDSKLWAVRAYNDAYAHIIQRASGTIRTVARSKLPSCEELAAISERRFDAIMRKAFHGEL